MKLTKLQKFLGKFEIFEGENEGKKEIKKNWNKFLDYFWTLFFLKPASRVIYNSLQEQFSNESNFLFITWIFIVIFQILITFSLAYLFGSYARKFTKNKIHYFFGIWGLTPIPFPVVGIFILRKIVKKRLALLFPQK